MSSSKALTHYDVLGVGVDVNTAVIKKAWLLAAWEEHPDLGLPEERDQRTQRMKALNEAYQVLSDPVKRRRYDLEHGLIAARCGSCGQPGSLRLDGKGQAIPVCNNCFQPGSHGGIAL